MKKETAVEFLLQEFSVIFNKTSFTLSQDLYIRDAIVKAKEMEKEQMISFYSKGCDDTYGIDEPVEGYDRKEAEEYYNETFKNES